MMHGHALQLAKAMQPTATDYRSQLATTEIDGTLTIPHRGCAIHSFCLQLGKYLVYLPGEAELIQEMMLLPMQRGRSPASCSPQNSFGFSALLAGPRP